MNGQKFIKYTFVTVGVYLVLQYATGFGKDLTAASNAYNSGVRSLQGRK